VEVRRALGKLFANPGFYAVSGPPGSGKSALCLHLLNAKSAAISHDRRFLADLHQAASRDEVRARITGSVRADSWDAALERLGSRSPSLLVLDNAESALVISPDDPDPILAELVSATKRSLRVLVACRGHGRLPSGVTWVRATELGALEPDESMRLLTHLAPQAAGVTRARDLMKTWGALPLSVTLLGRLLAPLSRRELDAIVIRAEELRRDGVQRANDLQYSFELTISTLTRHEKHLLGLISALPDGAHPDDVRKLFSGVQNPTLRVSRLYALGILELGGGGYRCLPPIGEYVQETTGLAPDPEEVAAAFTAIVGMLQEAVSGTAPDLEELPVLSQLANVAAALKSIHADEERVELGCRLASLDVGSLPGLAETALALLGTHEIAMTAELRELVTATASQLERQYRWQPAVTLLRLILGACRHAGDRVAEANALHELGRVALSRSRYDEAANYHEEALGMYHEIGERLGEANALDGLARVAYVRDRYDEAANHHEEALGIYREIGNRDGQATALDGLARVAFSRGRYDEAANHDEEALGIYREIGDRDGQATALHGLARVAFSRGRYDEAADHDEQALGIYREIGDRDGEARALFQLGAILKDRLAAGKGEIGHLARSREAFNAASALFASLGDEKMAQESATGSKSLSSLWVPG
jgi:tetratricopeptide (TPR) repeat protein